MKPARDSLPAGFRVTFDLLIPGQELQTVADIHRLPGDCDPADSCMGNYTLHVPFKVLEIPTGYQCLRIYHSAHTAVSRFG